MTRSLTFLGALAAAGIAAWLWFSAAGEPTASTGNPAGGTPTADVEPSVAEPVQPAVTALADTAPAPADPERRLQPGEQIPFTAPPGLTSGIRCPDGSYLPPLNGVPHAGPIRRGKDSGPWSPVVAKMCEADGTEWYVHADGSKTTSKYVDTVVEGTPKRVIGTLHITPRDPQGEAMFLHPSPDPAVEPPPVTDDTGQPVNPVR